MTKVKIKGGYHLHSHLVAVAGGIVERSEAVTVGSEGRAPGKVPQQVSHTAGERTHHTSRITRCVVTNLYAPPYNIFHTLIGRIKIACMKI